MSGDQAQELIAPPDHKDISGEEAWARRCSLSPMPPWPPQVLKTEESLLQDALATQLPSTLNVVKEKGILETQALNHQHQTSEPHSFLYSIPQWQPPEKETTGQYPSKQPTQIVPSRQTKPPSARLKKVPPPSLVSMRQYKKSSTQPQSLHFTALPRQLGLNEKIPGIYGKDVLDGSIGIRPRNKESIELQQLKLSLLSYGPKGNLLPRSMKLIIQQFMVANGYIYPYKHITGSEISTFRNSLLCRLDLHNTFMVTKETPKQQKLIKSSWASIDSYISEKSSEWRAQGVFQQASETARPIFAMFTYGWTTRNWGGSTLELTRATMVSTISPVLPMSPGSTSSEKSAEATRQVNLLDDDTETSLENPCFGLKPTLKRSCQDVQGGQDSQTNKRARVGDYSPVTNGPDFVDAPHNEANGLEVTTPKENGLPVVVAAIRHAQATMSEIAPMSAKDLATMRQDWASLGFPTMLAETLEIGRAYTVMMGKYFDSTLDLLSLLEESDQCKAIRMKVQMDRAWQRGASPEQLQNGRMAVPSNRKVEDQHPREREDTMIDGSEDEMLRDQPISSTRISEVDRLSQPGEGAVSDPPVAMTDGA